MRIPLEGLHTETGPGVLEAAIQYCEALEAADRGALFKTFTKILAQRNGMMATFMAKWSKDWPGQSGHIHTSLKRKSDGKAAFHDAAKPHNMSDEMRWYVGGQQKLMPELLAMVACTVNSYSRLIPGFWAPTTATWGVENRTMRAARDSGRRVEPARRIPHRRGRHQSLSRASPWRSARASTASRTRSSRTPMVEGNAYEKKFPKNRSLPRTLTEASEWLEKSKAGARACSATPSSSTSPRAASGKTASSAARSPTGSWRATSRSSDDHHHPHASIQKTVSPVDGRVYVERLLATPRRDQRDPAHGASRVQLAWRNVPLAERAAILTRFCDEFEKRGAQIAEELTWQMGRPARYAPNEVRGTLERARHMIAIAPQALGGPRRRAQGELHSASCAASRSAWCSPSPRGTTRISSP